MDIDERFNSHCQAEAHGCVRWLAGRTVDGYGRFSTGSRTDNSRKEIKAHRYAYERVHGKTSLQVLHKCNNPWCVNVEHLYVGTTLDNMQYKVASNRQAKGSKHGQAKLDECQVAAIRTMFSAGTTRQELAKMFNVNWSTINRLIKNETWSNINPEGGCPPSG